MKAMLTKRILVLDGAMGTQLQTIMREVDPEINIMGEYPPELLNVTYPEVVQKVHQQYLGAGSDLVLTNSFGGNRVRLKRFGLESRLEELNHVAVDLARKAGAEWVVGSMGPTGEMSSPMGKYTFSDFYHAFYPQIRALLEAGVDGLALETMLDEIELKAVVKAVRDQSQEIPLIAQASLFQGRMLQGPDLPTIAVMLDAMGVDVIGVNCVTLSEELVEIVRTLRDVTPRPLIVQPNAGMPDAAGNYHLHLSEWRRVIQQILATPGIGIVGGCCGTTPQVIQLLRQLVDEVNHESGPSAPMPWKSDPSFVHGQSDDRSNGTERSNTSASEV